MINLRQLHPILRTVNESFGGYRLHLSLIFPTMVIKTGLEIAVSLMFLPLLYELFPPDGQQSLPEIWNEARDALGGAIGVDSNVVVCIVVLVGLSAAKSAAGIAYYYVLQRTGYRYLYDARTGLFDGILGSRWLFHLERRAADSINAIVRETEKARTCFIDLVSIVEFAITVIFYILASAYISYLATIAAAASVLIVGIIIIPIARMGQRIGKRLILINQDLMQHLSELVSGLKVVKSSQMDGIARSLVARQAYLYSKKAIVVELLKQVTGQLLEPVIVIGTILFVLGMQHFHVVSLSESAVLAMLLYRCFIRASMLQTLWIKIFRNLPSVQLIADTIADFKANREAKDGENIESLEELEMQNLTFGYNDERVALDGIQLTITRGETIGIVGSSGAGKTTFIDSVLAFLPPTSGRIAVNGIDMQNLNPLKWREKIGYVPQEAVMFNSSIRENIALGREGITDEDIAWASRVAHADEFIDELPDGFETVVGDRGAKLSGGQRQRLALARAIARRPQILILDEATSAVDTHTEKRIQDSIEELRSQMTIFIVAHRLSTVMKADKVVVLDAGKTLEMGSPAELIERDGRFREMIAMQSANGS